jgi:hypothetical protein
MSTLAALNLRPPRLLGIGDLARLAALARGQQEPGALAQYASLDSSPALGALARQPGSTGGNDLDRAANAITRIESGGRYDAKGPVTPRGDRAYGRYQIMGANIPEWSQAALGRRLTPEEFLADQAAQDAIFRHRFGMYLTQYGPQDAASMWFTGQPYSVGRTRTDRSPNHPGGLTGQQYVSRFLAGYY